MDKQKWFKRRHKEAKENDEDPPTEDEWKLYLAEMKDWRLPVEELMKREQTKEVKELIASYSPEAFSDLYFQRLASKRRIRKIQEEQKKKFGHMKLVSPEKESDSTFSETFKKVCYGIGKEGRHFSTKEAFKVPEDDLIYIFHSPERKEADCLSRADLYRSFISKEVTEWKGEKRPLVSIPNDKLPPMWVIWTDDFKDPDYFAFELQEPQMMQIGSSFGISSLHGAKELVYEAKPIDPDDPSISELAKIPRRKDTSYLDQIEKKSDFSRVVESMQRVMNYIRQENRSPRDFVRFINILIENTFFFQAVFRAHFPVMSKFFIASAPFMEEEHKEEILGEIYNVFGDHSDIYFEDEIKLYDAMCVFGLENPKMLRRKNPGIVVKFNPNVDLLNFKGAENVYNAVFQEKDISNMRLDVSKEEFLRVAKNCPIPESKIWYDLLPKMSFEEIKSVSKHYRRNVAPYDLYNSNFPDKELKPFDEYVSPYFVNKLAPLLNFNPNAESKMNMFVINDKTLVKLNQKALYIVLRACFNRSHYLKGYEREFLDKLVNKLSLREFEKALEPFIQLPIGILEGDDDFSDEVLYYLSLKKPESSVLKTMIKRRKATEMRETTNKNRMKALKNFLSKNPKLIEGGGMNTLLHLNECLGSRPTTKAQKDKEKILLDYLNSL